MLLTKQGKMIRLSSTYPRGTVWVEDGNDEDGNDGELGIEAEH